MHRLSNIFLTLAGVLVSSSLLAENLDINTIKAIHEKVKSTLMEKCTKDFPDASSAYCECLGEKAQSYLDDTALGKCAMDESGGSCITKIVTDATLKSLAKDNLQACKAPIEKLQKDSAKEVDSTAPSSMSNEEPAAEE